MPTFTNPNNVSIVTGTPPSVHGIAGNYYLDRETGREIMMTDERLMRRETLLALMAHAGVKTAAVTVKDKLRKLLGRNLAGTCFSSESASAEIEELVGRARPDMYSSDLSLFVLDAGIALRERGAAELLYLSLSDYVQHAHAPGEPEADAFHRAIDARVRRFVELGVVVGLVADHGMNDKALPTGEPNAIFLEDVLNERFRSRGRAGHLPDHRSLCAPSRRPWLVRPRLPPWGCRSLRCHRGGCGAARGCPRPRRRGSCAAV
jgi:phosphonoacetate hydrolase